LNATQTAARMARISTLLDRLLPTIAACGLPFGSQGGLRWVGPPWTVTLWREGSNRIEIRLGDRQVFVAEWGEADVHVRHFAQQWDWDATLLAVLDRG
jgi:hypothetical protein